MDFSPLISIATVPQVAILDIWKQFSFLAIWDMQLFFTRMAAALASAESDSSFS